MINTDKPENNHKVPYVGKFALTLILLEKKNSRFLKLNLGIFSRHRRIVTTNYNTMPNLTLGLPLGPNFRANLG